MAADPVRERLRPAGLGVSEVGGAQHRDEHLRAPDLSRGVVHHLGRLPGIVDEHPLPGRVRLAHGWRQATAPIARKVTKTAVTIPIRLPGPILLPQQEEGHARLAKLGVHTGPIRLRPYRLGRERRREQLALQRRVIERLRHRPGNPDHGGPAQVFGNRVAADADHGRDLVAAVAADVFEAKDFSNLTHWQSLAWHGAPRDCWRDTVPSVNDCSRTAPPPAPSGVAGMRRNQWLASVGIRTQNHLMPSATI